MNHLRKFDLFQSFLFLLLVVLTTMVAPAGRAQSRPNLLCIVADDLGYGELG